MTFISCFMLHNMRVLAVGNHFFIISKMNKTSCFKSGHFININVINRTLHGRLGIQILSSRAESISHSFASLTRERYFQHEKIKFVSLRGHVISSIYPAVFIRISAALEKAPQLQCDAYSSISIR